MVLSHVPGIVFGHAGLAVDAAHLVAGRAHRAAVVGGVDRLKRVGEAGGVAGAHHKEAREVHGELGACGVRVGAGRCLQVAAHQPRPLVHGGRPGVDGKAAVGKGGEQRGVHLEAEEAGKQPVGGGAVVEQGEKPVVRVHGTVLSKNGRPACRCTEGRGAGNPARPTASRSRRGRP